MIIKLTWLIAINVFCAVSLTAQNIIFNDDNFKQKLTSNNKIDTNFDDEISHAEASVVGKLQLNDSSITDLAGIEFFVNLKELYIANNHLNTINLANLPLLSFLDCSHNQINNINTNNNPLLAYLDVSFNDLNSITVSNNIGLVYLDVSNNAITTLDTSNNSGLNFLSLTNNPVANINVSNTNNLQFLSVSNSAINDANMLYNTNKIWALDFSKNNLTNINLSNQDSLRWVHASQSNVQMLDFSNNPKLSFLDASVNQNLQNTLDLCAQDKNLLQFVLIENTSITEPYIPDVNVIANQDYIYQKEPNVEWLDCSELLATNNPTESPIKVYPNPASQYVYYKHADLLLLEIFSVSGQKVLAIKNPNNKIDVSALEDGVYILRASTKENQVLTHKLIVKKQRL